MDDYQELIERLRGFEIDHSPDGWPAIRMREISAMCNAVESLLAENERLKHNLTSTEQTMREYQELAAKRLVEIAKYRDAPVVGYTTTNEDGDLSMLFFDEQEARKYSGDDEPIKLIVKPGEEK